MKEFQIQEPQAILPVDQLANELRNIVAEMTSNLIAGLKRAAVIVKRLDEIGFDYAGFPPSIVSLARAVAQQRLLAETIRLQGSLLFNYAQKVPLATQEMIMRDEPVSVIDLTAPAPNPEITRRVPFSNLSKRELAIVFSENGVRNPEQQFIQLRQLQASKLPEAAPTIEDWCVDRKKGEIVIAGRRYSRKQLLKMLEAIERE